MVLTNYSVCDVTILTGFIVRNAIVVLPTVSPLTKNYELVGHTSKYQKTQSFAQNLWVAFRWCSRTALQVLNKMLSPTPGIPETWKKLCGIVKGSEGMNIKLEMPGAAESRKALQNLELRGGKRKRSVTEDKQEDLGGQNNVMLETGVLPVLPMSLKHSWGTMLAPRTNIQSKNCHLSFTLV